MCCTTTNSKSFEVDSKLRVNSALRSCWSMWARAAEGMSVQSWQHVYHQPPALSSLGIPLLPALPECQEEVTSAWHSGCSRASWSAHARMHARRLFSFLRLLWESGKARFNLQVLHNAAVKPLANKRDFGMRSDVFGFAVAFKRTLSTDRSVSYLKSG